MERYDPNETEKADYYEVVDLLREYLKDREDGEWEVISCSNGDQLVLSPRGTLIKLTIVKETN